MMFGKAIRYVLTIGVVWLALGQNLQAAVWTKTVPATQKTSIEASLRTANIDVEVWGRNEVKLESSNERGFDVRVLEDAVKISVEKDTKEPENKKGAGEGDLKLQVPQGVSLVLATISGNVRVDGMVGRCKIKCISGDVRITGCQGPVDIKTVSGDVTAKDIGATLSVKTVSGDVRGDGLKTSLLEAKSISGTLRFQKADAKEVRFKSHSGDIIFSGTISSQGTLEAKSFSGDVRVGLPAGSGFQLDSSTKSGDVKIGFALEQESREGGSVKGRAGNGGAGLELVSFSGDIEVVPGN